MVKKLDEYKRLRNERWNKTIRKSVFNFGDLPIFAFVSFSAIWVSISTSMYVYSINYQLFQKYISQGFGSSVIFAFALLTLLMFIVWFIFGSWCMSIFHAHVLLQKKEDKKRKTYVEKLIGE
jgi:hypothetical protein